MLIYVTRKLKMNRSLTCLENVLQVTRNVSSMTFTDHVNPLGQENFDPAKSIPHKWPISWKTSKNRLRLQSQIKLQPQTLSMVSEEERVEFKSIFPNIVNDLEEMACTLELEPTIQEFRKMLHYNVPNGELSRGLAVLASYKMLEASENLNSENIRLASILGWCAELFQSSFIIDDDIVDASHMRRGLLCWHIKTKTARAINDAEMLAIAINLILKRHFSQHNCYIPILELIRDVNIKTTMGQSLDLMCVINGKPRLEVFTISRFNAIAKYKTSYLAFQLPMALAMYLAEKYDPNLHHQASAILLEMGHFHQVENDVLDCFGDPIVTGKEGTDIQEGKCTWLITAALQRASRAQRRILETNYGRQEPECVNAVRNLYLDMNLLKLFALYEEQSFVRISNQISKLPKVLPQKLFCIYLEKTYRRQFLEDLYRIN